VQGDKHFDTLDFVASLRDMGSRPMSLGMILSDGVRLIGTPPVTLDTRSANEDGNSLKRSLAG
jgi:hypothetical protein